MNDDKTIQDHPLPTAEGWPVAIAMKPFGVFAAWHTFAFSKTLHEARVIAKIYQKLFQTGTWALWDRTTGLVIEEL